MALAATIVWEIRSDATASNVNGGGYKTGASGTDFSQQAAAQYNLTGVTTAGADAILLDATAAADMVGNIAHIISGTNFTAGFYEIISVSVGVSITLDRTCTSAAGSTGVVNIGGALSLGTATDDAIFELSVAGNKWWIKAGSYALGGAVSMAKTGTLASIIEFEGYNATRGDTPRGANRPLFTNAGNQFSVGQYCTLRNIRFTGTVTNVVILQYEAKAFNCQFRNTGTTAALYMLTDTFIMDCEVTASGGSAAIDSQGANQVVGCYIHSGFGGIIMQTTLSLHCIDTIFSGCKTYGIKFTTSANAGSLIKNCTFYGAETPIGIGIDMAAATLNVRILNNIFYGLVTGVTHAAAQTLNFGNFNNFFNCTTDLTNVAVGADDAAVNPAFNSVAQITGATATTSSNQLVDAAADFSAVVDDQDFVRVTAGTGVTARDYLVTAHTATTLTTSPAISNDATADKVYSITTGRDFTVGTAVKGLGFPAAMPYSVAATTTSFQDIGAAQREEAAATAVKQRGQLGGRAFRAF